MDYEYAKLKVKSVEKRIAAMTKEEKQSDYGLQSQSQLESYKHVVKSYEEKMPQKSNKSKKSK